MKSAVVQKQKREFATPAQAATIAENAYLYGLQQAIFYETRYTYTQDQSSNVFAGVNRYFFINEGKPISADFKAIVTPNATTLYATAFLDLQEEPVVMETPEITDRYFSLQIMDQYGIVYLYAGNQFNGTKARSYLIVPQGWDGALPADFPTADVIHAPTKTSFANIRIALMEGTDAEVHHINLLQEQCTITPLHKWLENGHRGLPQMDLPVISGTYATFPNMDGLTTHQVKRQTAEDFFTFLHLVLNDPSMPLMEDSKKEGKMLADLETIGLGPGKNFQWSALDTKLQEALVKGFKNGFNRVRKATQEGLVSMNGWMVPGSEGRFATDYLNRAVMADVGWAGPDKNISHAAAFLFVDADSKALDGKYRYTLTFDMNSLPPVTEFWSIPIYDADGYFVANELNRYTINSFMLDRGDLHIKDEKLIIYVQHDRPADPDRLKNWLPAPDGSFRFTARFYGPHMSLIDGSYHMPRPVKVNESVHSHRS